MKPLLTVAFCLLFLAPTFLFAQVDLESPQSLLDAPDDWQKEVIPFPLSFAPSLNYIGIEDIRFAPGWGKQESDEFWTYAFLWYLDMDPSLNEEKLARDMEIYFDGLMTAVAEGRGIDSADVHPTMALFAEYPFGDKRGDYKGRIRVFDAFSSRQTIALNVQVETFYCDDPDKLAYLFRISPRQIGDPVWKKLREIKLGFECNPND